MTSSSSTKVVQIFEYLLAVKKLNENIIRSVNDYEKVWWQADIPNLEGCYLGENGTNPEAWLEVHKQVIQPTPALPRELHNWINNWDNPDIEPEPVHKKIIGIDDETEEEIL